MEQPSWINRTLNNRYTIQALLGQGGMSAVYKANDPNLKRVVAVKLIHSHLATDPRFITRFEEEATAVARLRHPNIVQVFDFNTDGGVYYMVLEFIPGETLQEHLKRLNKAGRHLPIEEVIKYTINLCDALGYAHRQGIIHRDIKPANIMLDVHGQAILMDFGIVKIIGGDSHTATGAVVGTARYMSPEVIRAEVPDQRSDIYSLGITLFEMLSGETPFNSDSAMSLMMMHLNEPVPDLSRVRSDIPPALLSILQKSLEKDANRRFSSAADMATALKRVQAELEGKETVIGSTASESTKAGTSEVSAASPQNISNATFTQTSMAADSSAVKPGKMETVAVNAPSRQTAASLSSPLHTTPKPAAKNTRLLLLLGVGGVGLFLLFVLIGGFFLLRNILSPGATGAVSTSTPEIVFTATTISTLPVVVEVQETPTLTPEPTIVPTDTPIPTSTFPSLYVQITNITIDSSNYYVVEYQTYGYTEKLPGMHVHFFFNTVSPEQAGMPGSGPWYLYGGPRPFKGYSVSERPSEATQICALVANANHSIILGSGNCFDLP